LFNLKINTNINLTNELSKLNNKGWNIFLTDLNAEKYFNEINIDIKMKNIFVFGNEAKGVNQELLSDKNFNKIKIKGYSKCESLNVGISAGIILDYVRNRS